MSTEYDNARHHEDKRRGDDIRRQLARVEQATINGPETWVETSNH